MNQQKTERFRRRLAKLFDERYPHIRPLTRDPFISDVVRIFEQRSWPTFPDDPELIPEVQFWGD